MQEYSKFPPYRYFCRVLKNCAKCAHLYTQLWEQKNKKMQVSVPKEEIRKKFLVSPTLFRGLLGPLALLNLLDFEEKSDIYEIELIGLYDR